MFKVSHSEKIECPECGKVQKAKVLLCPPWDIRVHECEECYHIIMESEWNVVQKKTKDEHKILDSKK